MIEFDHYTSVMAILMDHSKALDCLPHDLLLLNFKYYGLSENALKLMKSYLTNRKQCVRLGSIKSDFEAILKGVPQGSIIGPVLFNIFLLMTCFILLRLVVCRIMQTSLLYHAQTRVMRMSFVNFLRIVFY